MVIFLVQDLHLSVYIVLLSDVGKQSNINVGFFFQQMPVLKLL